MSPTTIHTQHVQHSPPVSNHSKPRGYEYKNYVSINTPTDTQMSATISASHLINLDKYSKPSPLPTINNSEYDSIGIDQDTLGKNVHKTTHKTVDLPSPHAHKKKHKNKNKKHKNKKQHYYSDDEEEDEDEDMNMLANYDEYNSITQTEDEQSLEPTQPINKQPIVKEDDNENENKNNLNRRKLELLNQESGNLSGNNSNEPLTDEGNLYEIEPLKQIKNKNNKHVQPRFSTLSIDSDIQNDNDLGMNSGIHNLIVEDESLMDELNVSPRFKNSRIIEFYVNKSMSMEQIKRCFGIFEPIKIIPHTINTVNNNKKIEAIFDSHDKAIKAVQMLKHQNLQVVFKKSPRQTLINNQNQTPILQPIDSQGPFQSIHSGGGNMNNKVP